MTLQITKAQPADAQALADILTQAMNFKVSLGDKAWGDYPYTAEEMCGIINAGNTYSVRYADQLIGTLMLLWEDKMVWGEQPPIAGYLHQLAIKDAYRGHGAGEQIIDWASRQVASRGKKFLRLDFPPDNHGLKKYYEEQGFEFIRRQEVHAPDKIYEVLLYERLV